MNNDPNEPLGAFQMISPEQAIMALCTLVIIAAILEPLWSRA